MSANPQSRGIELLDKADIRHVACDFNARLITFFPLLFMDMDNLTFGLTMLLVGMGGTLFTLWILAVLIGLLTRICQPHKEGADHD